MMTRANRAVGVVGFIGLLLATLPLVQGEDRYPNNLRKILEQHCVKCHGPDKTKGKLRIDTLDADFINGKDAAHWFDVLNELNTGAMPPDDEPPLPGPQLVAVVDWLTEGLEAAAAAMDGTPGHAQRLNNMQYADTLRDLFGLTVDYSEKLLKDSAGKSGFTTDASAQFTSPAHIEEYMEMARTVVDRALPAEPPTIHHFKLQLRRDIGKPSKGGMGRYPVPASHFRATRFEAKPPFKAFQPNPSYEVAVFNRKKGATEIQSLSAEDHTYYVERHFEPDYKNPDGAYVSEDGMELQPIRQNAKRRADLPDQPTLSINTRAFPTEGRFVLRVEAYREALKHAIPYDEPGKKGRAPQEAAPLEPDVVVRAQDFEPELNATLDADWLRPVDPDKPARVTTAFDVKEEGVYLVHRWCEYETQNTVPRVIVSISINGDVVNKRCRDKKRSVAPECLVKLHAGTNVLSLDGAFGDMALRSLSFTKLDESDERAKRLAGRDHLIPTMRTFMGRRNATGHEVRFLGEVHEVLATKAKPAVYEFYGDLEEFPLPSQPTPGGRYYESLMTFGVENNQLASMYGPSIIVKSIELEGPLHPEWPTAAEKEIFFRGAIQPDEAVYAREVLSRFMARAFRRPPTQAELESVHSFWKECRAKHANFKESIKETLALILTTPQFMFVVDPAADPESNALSDYELASRLSYFLWNSLPDDKLLAYAKDQTLRAHLASEVLRMLEDEKSRRFSKHFTDQWLELGKSKQVVTAFPLDRYYRDEFLQETHHFFHEVVRSNGSALDFVDCNYVMVNQNLAHYYGVEGRFGAAFQRAPVAPDSRRGGVLTQASTLLVNSTGMKSHPIKRGVWIAARILGSPPPDPPPGVPEIDELDPKFRRLSLIQQLEVHRDYAACRNCHQRIDPWGLPLESFGADGRFNPNLKSYVSVLPDKTSVEGIDALKAYLLSTKDEQAARSLISYLMSYAIGRELSFGDGPAIDAIVNNIKPSGFKVRDIIVSIVESEPFQRY